MRREFLSDACDFWKRGILDLIRDHGRAMRVVPMLADVAWSPEDLRTCADLLGTGVDNIGPLRTFTNTARHAYFSEAGMFVRERDVFIDPDTGVALANPRPAHLVPDDVARLPAQDNVVAIYQHGSRDDGAGLRGILNSFTSFAKVVAYEGQVSMIIVSGSDARIAERGQA